MSEILHGSRMLVTGGGSGIGRGVVDAYVAAGGHVTVLERSASNADQLLSDHPVAITALQGDATEPEDLAAAVRAAVGDAVGLDNLTCCVGVFDYYASLRDMSVDELVAAAEEIWRTNLLSSLLAVKIALPALERAHGSVTLTLSGAGFYPEGGGVLYGSTKWALRGVVSHLAKDLGPLVRINGVAPGGTSGTHLGGLRALAQTQTADRVAGRDERISATNVLHVTALPADHAGAYLYLADPKAARIVTGTVLNTDGGRG